MWFGVLCVCVLLCVYDTCGRKPKGGGVGSFFSCGKKIKKVLKLFFFIQRR